ncbi:hypothetical protein BsWGS_26553 [Bradybaena similaris]
MEARCCVFILAALAFGGIRGFKFTLYDSARVSWHEAQERCRTADRILARVDTEPDKIWVYTLSQYVKRNFWIGLSRQQGNDTFTWIDSSILDYSNWAEGYPVKAATPNDMDCVRIRLGDFRWETDNCSLRLNFLYHTETYATKKDKEIKGMLLGLLFLFCMLLVCYLLLQLPCCRLEKPAIVFVVGPRRAGKKGDRRSDRDLLI